VIGRVIKLEKDYCPVCLYTLDAASGFDNNRPEPGDITVCLNCAFILVFKKNMKVRKATNKDLSELDKETREKLSKTLFVVNRYIIANSN